MGYFLTHREKFFAYNGPGPHNCFFCGKRIKGIKPREFQVHHRNGDKTNSQPSNLKAVHHTCHTGHHARGNVYQRGLRCKSGCKCGKHKKTSNPCKVGCKCPKHMSPGKKCLPGCQCKRHDKPSIHYPN